MAQKLVALVGLGLIGSAAAKAVVKEAVATLPSGWQVRDTVMASDAAPMTLSIAIRHDGMGVLKSRLADISNPEHRDFGHHLSQDEVAAYRAPTKESTDAVVAWLHSKGLTDTAIYHDWVRFNATLDEASSLFQTEFEYYSYEGGDLHLRTRSYTLPSEVAHLIDFVHPITNFMPPQTTRLRQESLAKARSEFQDQANPCSGSTTPSCIRQLYNIRYSPPAGPSPVRFGVAGFLEEFVNYQDVATFLLSYANDLPKDYNFTVELVNNGTNPQRISDAGLEASLDIDYAMALGYPTNVTYYSTGGRGVKLDSTGQPLARSDNEPYLEFLEYLLAKPDNQLPHVLSFSYADDEQTVPLPYALRVCDMLAALTGRGVTIVAASGDGGARGTGQSSCLSNDGSKRGMTMPTFPSTCPYVTTVGATSSDGPPSSGASFSTGGFSNLFPRPAWQEAAVKPYADHSANSSLAGYFNASGRAFPDVSAIGTGFIIQWAGSASLVQGTSASAPVIGAMLALVNDARLRAGKNATGWITPLLYSDKMAGIFQDIVSGSSQSCTFPDGKSGGWPATPGYDCITGLGVPYDFTKLLAAFMAI